MSRRRWSATRHWQTARGWWRWPASWATPTPIGTCAAIQLPPGACWPSGMPITLVGMHVTLGAKMRAEQLRRLFAEPDPLSVALARCVLAWRTWKRRMPILHDALTVAVAADPTLAHLRPRRVFVGWRGFSFATRMAVPNALVCTAVDLGRFHALLDAAAAWRRNAAEHLRAVVPAAAHDRVSPRTYPYALACLIRCLMRCRSCCDLRSSIRAQLISSHQHQAFELKH